MLRVQWHVDYMKRKSAVFCMDHGFVYEEARCSAVLKTIVKKDGRFVSNLL